jgi:hypothetical protein
MRVRVPRDTLLYVRAKGADAVVTLVTGQFDEDHANTCSSSGDD